MDQNRGTGYQFPREFLPHDKLTVELGQRLIKRGSCEFEAKYLTRGSEMKSKTDRSLVLEVDKDNEIVAAPRTEEPEAADKLTYADIGRNYQKVLRVFELCGCVPTEDVDKIKKSTHGLGEDGEPLAATRDACEMLMKNFWEAMRRYTPTKLVDELVAPRSH